MRLFVLAVMLFLIMNISSVFGQDEAADSYYGIQPRNLVDAPTAWTLPRGCFDVVLRAYPNGGILASTAIGLSNRFMIGISYGAEGVIAEEEPDWNPKIEFNLKLKLIDEAYYLPAFSLGFVSQGYGYYDDDLDRYVYKSKGFYAVITRSLYLYNWTVGGHAGINYSLEDDGDNDDDPTLFFGIDTQFNNNIGLVMEYDVALNDDKSGALGRGRGYMNLGLKWLYSENLEIEAILKDLLNNRGNDDLFGRELRLTYMEYF